MPERASDYVNMPQKDAKPEKMSEKMPLTTENIIRYVRWNARKDATRCAKGIMLRTIQQRMLD